MLKSFLLPIIWLAVVTYLSTMPGVALPKFDLFSVDKLAHAFVYAVLSVLIYRVFLNQNRQIGLLGKTAIFLFSSAYGAFMEYVQGAYFPGRFFEFDDMTANCIGAAVVFLPLEKRLRNL